METATLEAQYGDLVIATAVGVVGQVASGTPAFSVETQGLQVKLSVKETV